MYQFQDNCHMLGYIKTLTYITLKLIHYYEKAKKTVVRMKIVNQDYSKQHILNLWSFLGVTLSAYVIISKKKRTILHSVISDE